MPNEWPEGYTALKFTVSGLSNYVNIAACDRCGALVGGWTAHNKFHDSLQLITTAGYDEAIVKANIKQFIDEGNAGPINKSGISIEMSDEQHQEFLAEAESYKRKQPNYSKDAELLKKTREEYRIQSGGDLAKLYKDALEALRNYKLKPKEDDDGSV